MIRISIPASIGCRESLTETAGQTIKEGEGPRRKVIGPDNGRSGPMIRPGNK
jgi:hypothetical protein